MVVDADESCDGKKQLMHIDCVCEGLLPAEEGQRPQRPATGLLLAHFADVDNTCDGKKQLVHIGCVIL